jgi:hypothetical protein
MTRQERREFYKSAYPEAKGSAPGARQFNWRRHWSKKVDPYLHEELVQVSLDFGMGKLEPDWKRGDAPWVLGAIGDDPIVKGKLSWYRPLGRCHHIAFFAMAVGVLNYPDLDWRFVSGDLHTVAVGYGPDGSPRVVMDILQFDFLTAEQSLAHAQVREQPAADDAATRQWDADFAWYVANGVPALKRRARQLRQAREAGRDPGSTAAGAKPGGG